MKQLLARAYQGDKTAEEELFELVLSRFNLYARRRVGDRDVAADIAQESCVTVFSKYKTEKYTVGFEAWAYGVLKMNIRHYFHKLSAAKQREAVTAESVKRLSSPQQTIDPDLEREVLDCLRKLLSVNRRYARAINLTFQGYRGDEICRRMGISRNNFYVLLNRARAVLKKCLEKGEL